MTKEQIAVIKGLMNASKKCANTFMRAIDTLKAEKRPVPAYYNIACNKCFGAVKAYEKVLELIGEKQSGLPRNDEMDGNVYQRWMERK